MTPHKGFVLVSIINVISLVGRWVGDPDEGVGPTLGGGRKDFGVIADVGYDDDVISLFHYYFTLRLGRAAEATVCICGIGETFTAKQNVLFRKLQHLE